MVDTFSRDGFFIFRDVLKNDSDLNQLKNDLEALGRLFISDFSIEESARQLHQMTSESRGTFYRGLRYLPSITRLACHPHLLKLSRELGLQFPAVMHSYNLRMDVPNDQEHMFHWHQDITYLLGSENSLTYWIPLSRANEKNGSIEIITGSHKAGVAPIRYAGGSSPLIGHSLSPKDVYLEEDPKGSGTVIDADFGDIVVFSQLLLHRSAPNLGKLTRWTIQVRHCDLSEAKFRAAGYPLGDYTNIFCNDYLPGFNPSKAAN